ncbi:MAG: Gfo/Idh/MocA family oxidoreductase [Akkermansiaceae bacterium]|nr:Gfo/Idh/MocA family oxidoreductase [Armatimonadota bacterium]
MIRIGIIGVGGFAANHHQSVQALEAAGECRLVCACDPNPDALAKAGARLDFAGRGVRIHADYREMIAAHRHELDVVTVPTPIPLHAEMHRECVENGVACYLEKPPTLDPDELERMIVAERGAEYATQVAFNFIVEEPRRRLKARILAGEFGQMRRVSFMGLWARPLSYFVRNGWAGRLLWDDGRLVLDSCIGNAMAHFVHNLLFWAGTGNIDAFAGLKEVEAELYRAHAVETFDTCFVRALCDGGAELRIAATHTGARDNRHEERITCDDATVVYKTGNGYQILDREGNETERGENAGGVLVEENLRAYFAYVRGETRRPMTRLVDARPFVHLNALAYVAAGAVTDLGAECVRQVAVTGAAGEVEEYLVADGVRAACETFAATGVFPTGQGATWACPGARTATANDLWRIRPVAETMLTERAAKPPNIPVTMPKV